MSDEFQEEVALVTGGSRGIGRAVALQLARGGANVAIGYCSRTEAAEEVVAQIEGLGRKAILARCDLRQQDQVDEFVRQSRSSLGRVTLLANCGAISNMAHHTELDFDLWQDTIDANLNGAFRILFAVKDEMLEQKHGSIVLISSVAALRPRQRQIHYASAKAGVIALTRCCGEAFAPHVRINCIAPGLIDTEMAKVLSAEQTAHVQQMTPMGRLGHAEEIAEVACFLLSRRSSFMTGQTVVASGGRVTLP